MPAATSKQAVRRDLYACLDWSERRDHFAGAVAAHLLEQFLARKWFTRVEGSRALHLTPRGKQQLMDQLLKV